MKRPLKVAFRRQALDDLQEIAAYIGQEDPAAASRVIQRIHQTVFRTLAHFPHGGRLDAESGAREYPVPGLPYLVIFQSGDELLDVIAVFHTARDPQTKPRP